MDRRMMLAGSATLAVVGSKAHAATRTAPAPSGPANGIGLRMAGVRMLPVRNGRYTVWTKTVGHGPIKLLLLHGGPGASHDYLEGMGSFLPPAGMQIIYYDQLGCGNSDRPGDAALWTLAAYLDEVEEVRRGLGLDRFVLYGHSFGGILALEYALRHPARLEGLVVSNMAASMAAYLKRTESLKALLDPATRRRLTSLERAEAYDDPAYQAIITEKLYPQILCRMDPWPEPLLRSFTHLNQQIYETMQGKSEFLVTGNLKGWDRWSALPDIRVRALTIGARHDEMDPADMIRMATLMPNATSFICPNGSHMCMWDDQAIYFDRLIAWLRASQPGR